MLLELLVAMAFLVVVTGITLRMHQARLDYDRASMDRLRQQLAIENIAEQLVAIPYSEIPEIATSLAIKSGARCTVEPFVVESTKGWHVIIESESDRGPLNHHLWRLEQKR